MKLNHSYRQNQPGTGRTVGTRSQIKGLPQAGEKELPRNQERNNHQGLGNALIRPEPEHAGAQGAVIGGSVSAVCGTTTAARLPENHSVARAGGRMLFNSRPICTFAPELATIQSGLPVDYRAQSRSTTRT